MNIIEPPAPRTNAPARGMLLHCGAQTVSREDLLAVPTPPGTKTWYPLSHCKILAEVETQLKSSGFSILEETHALSHEGARYFGVMSVTLPNRGRSDFGWIVGIRNSHDMTYPDGLVAGTRVFVCDNLCFCGEVKISRKHTRFAERDLRHLTARAVGQLGDRFHGLDQRVLAYKKERITNKRAHDIIIRAVDCAAITPAQIPSVLIQWREPEHESFEPRNAWSLFNAFTEVYKTANPHTALRRGEALHGLFDAETGVALAS